MKVSQQRIYQVLNLDPVKQKPQTSIKSEETPEQVLRYLNKREALALKLERAPSKVNPFTTMRPKEIDLQTTTYGLLRTEALKFMRPLYPELIAGGADPEYLDDIAGDMTDTYMHHSRQNTTMGRLTFAQFLAATLFIRADAPIWLSYLPMVREGKIAPNWANFHKLFNETMAVMKDLSPMLHRQQFRGMYNTDTFKATKEGDVIELNQPSSSSKEVKYAEEFMHADKPHLYQNYKGAQHIAWDAKAPPTIGDNLMQIWDVQDAINNASIWECDGESGQQVSYVQRNEHLLLKGTQLEVLLKATAEHPKSKRPVTFLVTQDVRSKVLGQQQRLLEALDLEQKK